MNIITDRKKIVFNNNSLTNRVQQLAIIKIGSHFRIPQKLLRAALDEDSLKEGIVRFPSLDMIEEDFYIIAEPVTPALLINYKQFIKSDLHTRLVLMNDQDMTTVLNMKGTPWVLINYTVASTLEGVGGLYLNYPDFKESVVLPMREYLRGRYPAPLS